MQVNYSDQIEILLINLLNFFVLLAALTIASAANVVISPHDTSEAPSQYG